MVASKLPFTILLCFAISGQKAVYTIYLPFEDGKSKELSEEASNNNIKPHQLACVPDTV